MFAVLRQSKWVECPFIYQNAAQREGRQTTKVPRKVLNNLVHKALKPAVVSPALQSQHSWCPLLCRLAAALRLTACRSCGALV